jgi:hypothetical protein
MQRRVTADERDSLIAAYLGCLEWRTEGDAVSGEHAGWRIWMSTRDGTATGFAANKTLEVTVELTPTVIRAWIKRVREKLQRN